jgi:hypothetical protein
LRVSSDTFFTSRNPADTLLKFRFRFSLAGIIRERIAILTAMLLSSRSLLPLFLVILQFFAPLLHAHTGQQHPHFGLHIPGLEAYNTVAGGAVASQPEACCTAAQDCIVAVGDGFRENTERAAEHPAGGDCLPLVAWIFSTAAEPDALASFPQPPSLQSRHRIPSPSPRAPPLK